MPIADTYDWSGAQAKLKQGSGQWYDDSQLDDLKRNAKEESDIDPWIGRLSNKAKLRGGNQVGSTYTPDGAGGTMGAAAQQQNMGGAATSNPNLDRLVQQMIENNKAQADRDAASAAQKDAWRNQMRGNIMDRYNKVAADPSMEDPILARASQVHNAAGQRALSQGREVMAARMGTQHLGTGAADAALAGSYENLGKDQAGYESGLLMNENDKRRGEVQNLLGLGAGVINSDENRMLSDKLGTIDAAQGGLRLGLEGQQIRNNWDLGNRNLDLQGRGMENQDRQFYDNMGNNNGLQAAMMNQYLMQQLMGGG